MEPWQERLLEEKKQLDDKINRLYAFTQAPAFQSLPADDRGLLGEHGSSNNPRRF